MEIPSVIKIVFGFTTYFKVTDFKGFLERIAPHVDTTIELSRVRWTGSVSTRKRYIGKFMGRGFKIYALSKSRFGLRVVVVRIKGEFEGDRLRVRFVGSGLYFRLVVTIIYFLVFGSILIRGVEEDFEIYLLILFLVGFTLQYFQRVLVVKNKIKEFLVLLTEFKYATKNSIKTNA